jgi:hypothetical protein
VSDFADHGAQKEVSFEKKSGKSRQAPEERILIEQRRAKLLILLVAGGGIEPPTLGL